MYSLSWFWIRDNHSISCSGLSYPLDKMLNGPQSESGYGARYKILPLLRTKHSPDRSNILCNIIHINADCFNMTNVKIFFSVSWQCMMFRGFFKIQPHYTSIIPLNSISPCNNDTVHTNSSVLSCTLVSTNIHRPEIF